MIKPVSIQELISDGYLSQFRVFVEPELDLTGVRTLGGDFREDDLAALAGRSVELNANVISTWQSKGEGRPTLVYAVDRPHSRALTDRFLAARIPTEHVDCDTSSAEREAIFARFTAGETRVICNVATLDTGLDLDARCIVDCRPTKSRISFVQTIGRGLRTADGKLDCLILDHAGNHTRLGAVTDIHVRHLLKGSEEQEAPPSRHTRPERSALGPKECRRECWRADRARFEGEGDLGRASWRARGILFDAQALRQLTRL